MGSEFSRDCPPCSTSSFGGETDMMYMPAAGTCYRKSLAPPSRIGTADHVTTGPRMAVDLQDSRRRAASEGSGAISMPYSGLTTFLQDRSLGSTRASASAKAGSCTLEARPVLPRARTGGDAMPDGRVQPRESCCATASQPLQHERYAVRSGCQQLR